VTKLKLLLDSGRANNADTAVLFATLANNRGLVDLDLYCCSINNDNWSILCESLLQTHPTLTKLDLSHTGRFELLTDNQKTHRTRMLVNRVQRNTSLHTIILSELCQDTRDEEIYAQMILPHLETNRYRPRVDAIKKADIPLRRPLLGWARCKQSRSGMISISFGCSCLGIRMLWFDRSNTDNEQGRGNSCKCTSRRGAAR
jgi:hypothetical protein